MQKSNSDKAAQYQIFDCIRRAVKKVNTGIKNSILFHDGKIELIKSWRKESPYWLYTRPDSVFDPSTQSYEDFEAFSEEIKFFRRLKNSEDRNDYFHELNQFYNGDLKALNQSITEQINEVTDDIEKIRKSEPDQLAEGRPVMGRPDGSGPKARKKVFENYIAEVEKWANTSQGKKAIKQYEQWKDTFCQLIDYQELLFKLQFDVHQIGEVILDAFPSSLESQTDSSSKQALTDSDKTSSNGLGKEIKIGFESYIKSEHQAQLMGYLRGTLSNKGPRIIVPVLFALEKEGVLITKLGQVNQSDLHRSLSITFGKIGARNSLSNALSNYDDQKANANEKQKIESYRLQINKVLEVSQPG